MYTSDAQTRYVFYTSWMLYFMDLHRAKGGTPAEIESRGWTLYKLLYLQERTFNFLTDETWTANRAKIGYSTYAKKPELNGNDNMLIAISFLTGKDHRPTFNAWGIQTSAAAQAQVQAFGFEKQTPFFYAELGHYINAKRVDLVGDPSGWVWPHSEPVK
jgi:immunomodulating metalloprotease